MSSEIQRALEYPAQVVKCTRVHSRDHKLHTLRWHLFVQPVLIQNRARPRIQRALDYSAQFRQAEINRLRANYSRKYSN